MRIGFIGAGNMGGNLANLLQSAGQEVIAGLRNPSQRRADARYRTGSVAEAAENGEVVILALHYASAAGTLPPLAAALADKVVIDATNPLNDDWSPLLLGEATSGAEQIARLLPQSRVVKAFNTIFADVMTPERLDRGGRRITAFVAGDHAEANEAAGSLAEGAGFAPILAGPLRNARHLEALAHLNIAIAVGQGGGTNAAFVYDQARPEARR